MTDVWLIVVFGMLGYLFEKFRIPISAMLLGAVLGPVGENAFMRTMIATGNNWTIFFREPICGTLMFGAIAALLFPFARDFVRRVRGNANVAAE